LKKELILPVMYLLLQNTKNKTGPEEIKRQL